VHFDTKIAIILDQQLAVWQKANVTAFLISYVKRGGRDRRGGSMSSAAVV